MVYSLLALGLGLVALGAGSPAQVAAGAESQTQVSTPAATPVPPIKMGPSKRRRDVDTLRIDAARQIVEALTADATAGAPRSSLKSAAGILIFPAMEHVPSRPGQGPQTRRLARMHEVDARGILSVRQDGSSWSVPAFVSVDGLGLTEGADLILVLLKPDAVEKALRHEFRLAEDAPSDVIAYVRHNGVVSPATLSGIVHPDTIANQRFYGKTLLTTARAVEQSTGPDAATEWREAASKLLK
jgi:hypothetical protein